MSTATTEKAFLEALDDYDAERNPEEFTPMTYPSKSGNETVYVKVVNTRVKKLYRCQIVIIRRSLDGEARFWASSGRLCF